MIKRKKLDLVNQLSTKPYVLAIDLEHIVAQISQKKFSKCFDFESHCFIDLTHIYISENKYIEPDTQFKFPT